MGNPTYAETAEHRVPKEILNPVYGKKSLPKIEFYRPRNQDDGAIEYRGHCVYSDCTQVIKISVTSGLNPSKPSGMDYWKVYELGRLRYGVCPGCCRPFRAKMPQLL